MPNYEDSYSIRDAVSFTLEEDTSYSFYSIGNISSESC